MSSSSPKHSEDSAMMVLKSKETQLFPGEVVRRALPQVKRRTIGPWCFLDHFGPTHNHMNVGPHPHTGLCTLTYLYHGQVWHRDSTGANQAIHPNQVNLMCAGKGVTHSERPPPDEQEQQSTLKDELHGIQLWIALPKDQEDVEPSFHHASSVVSLPEETNSSSSVQAKLVVGSLGDYEQEEIPLVPGLEDMFLVSVEFDPTKDDSQKQSVWKCPSLKNTLEIGIYVASGSITVRYESKGAEDDGDNNPMEKTLHVGDMMYLPPTADNNDATGNHGPLFLFDSSPSDDSSTTTTKTRVAILGGVPFHERRHLLWNFCSHDRDKLQAAADAWQRMDRTIFPPVAHESNNDSIPLPAHFVKR